jgi:hypothetical protein
MVQTKLGKMQVICANCGTGMTIKNYGNLPCDVCGKIAARVTYGDLEMLRDALEEISSMANIWNEKEVAIANKALGRDSKTQPPLNEGGASKKDVA